MLGRAELQRHLERIKYKPNWSIRVEEIPEFSGRLYLSVSFITEDSWRPGQTTKIGMRTQLRQPVLNTDQFEHLVLQFLDQAERHETREWFKVDGVAKFDPHKKERVI